MPDVVRLECPEWLQPSLERAWGASRQDELAAFNAPGTIDLRVNTLKANRDKAQKVLARDRIDSEPTALSPIGLRLPGRARLGSAQAYKDGLVEVQDEGSQLAALMVDAQPGMAVADLCAGGGGKTLALAAALTWGRQAGRLVAGDVSSGRLEGLRKRLRRAGLLGIEIVPAALSDETWLAQHRATFDRVLIDVPCSGTGTWRRNPDARWRLTPADLTRYGEAQQDILKSASDLVKPDGRLVYVTCSVLREENEDRIAAFLDGGTPFVPLDAGDLWRGVTGSPPPGTGPFLRLSPRKTGTDGFFIAVLQRGS